MRRPASLNLRQFVFMEASSNGSCLQDWDWDFGSMVFSIHDNYCSHLANGEWFVSRPKLAESITITVFKVPGETIAGLCHVNNHIGKRVSVAKEPLFLQTVPDKGVERREVVNGPQGTFELEIVCGDEAVGALVEARPWIFWWKRIVWLSEVGVGSTKRPMALISNSIGFGAYRLHPAGREKPS